MKHEPSGRERPPANPNRRTARSGLEQRVLRRARDRGLHGVPIVVGFSGGADSLCLAAVLAAIQRNLQISPVLVHVNHGLRPESDKESDRVTELARTLDLPLTLVRLADGLRERHRGVGIEEAARRERYRALATAAKRLGTDLVATAHHQNDQAETVLMHLMRGTGLEGASGMRELSKTTVPWWAESDVVPVSIRLWRPLLQEPKSEIEACVESLTMSPVQDSSNTDRTFRRNSIRHDLLPAMEAVYPRTRGSLARFAEVAAAEDEFMQGLAAEAYARCVQSDGTLNLTEWYGLPTAIQRRVMLKWLRERAGTNEVTFERAISVTDLAQTRRLNATIEVAAGCPA